MRSCGPSRRAAAIFATAAILLATPAGATPIKFTTAVGTVKWKVPMVTFYIPLDPKPGGKAHDDVKKAVDEWNKTTSAKGLTLKAVILDAKGNLPGTNDPPDPSVKGTMIVKYTTGDGDSTPLFEGMDTGTKDAKGNKILKDAEFTDGEMKVGTNAPGLVYPIALHEVGHSLGLDHDTAKDSVMQERVDDYAKLTTPGATDVREFGSTYARADAKLDGSAFALATGDFQYNYTVTWLSGGDIALIDVLVLGAPTSDPQIPLGWSLVMPPDGEPFNFFSVRVDLTDDLQAYLNAANPTLQFSFVSSSSPTLTFGWAGSDQPVQSVIGPQAVPEASTAVLCLVGAVLTVLLGRRRAVGARM